MWRMALPFTMLPRKWDSKVLWRKGLTVFTIRANVLPTGINSSFAIPWNVTSRVSQKDREKRASVFGALHLLQKQDQGWVYRGKVGTGFDTDFMQYLRERLDTLTIVSKPFDTPTPDDKVSTWVKPELICEVEYASITDQGTLREPVFKSLMEDR